MRVAAGLTQGLHQVMDADERTFFLGMDVADPYGGAFGISRGLSTRFPDRVISTPISEGAMVGVAAGMALLGDRVIVEVMFGDFLTLCLDPLLNFVSKSVSMYGRRLDMKVLVRCPSGGNRGYGPTHSQSLQKLVIGVPNLRVFELSPFHEAGTVLEEALGSGDPGVLFENKVLYTTPAYWSRPVGGVLRQEHVDHNWVLLSVDDRPPDWLVIAPGGLVPRVLPALERALLEREVSVHLLVPSQLYPLQLPPVLTLMAEAGRLLAVEDGVAGGGWACTLAEEVHRELWGRLREPVRILQPPCRVIPAAPQLERHTMVGTQQVLDAVLGTRVPERP